MKFQQCFVFGVFASLSFIAASPTGQQPKRNTSDTYEDGGTLVADRSDGERVVAKIETKLRDFLWSKWVYHKRARIAFKGTTTEGTPWRYDFRVESDERGTWIIDVRFASEALSSDDKTYQTTEAYKVYTVERRRISGSGRGPSTYRLILKDKQGSPRAEL